MLRVHRGGLALVDTEKVWVEAGDVVDERAPLRHRTALDAGLRVVQFVGVPAVGGYLGDHVVTAEQGFPQLVWGINTAREAASHANNGDRGQRGSAHSTHTSLFVNAVHDVSLRGGPTLRCCRAIALFIDSRLPVLGKTLPDA